MGAVLCVLVVGALGLSLWEGFSVRRAYASAADAAAQAGANALDVDVYTTSGDRVLDSERARALAASSLAEADLPGVTDMSVTATADEIVVVVTGEVRPALLGLLGAEPLAISVRAVGGP